MQPNLGGPSRNSCTAPAKLSRIDDRTVDTMDWSISFLMGTGFSQNQWRPVIRGHAVTGDIIVPIRTLSETTGPATQSDAAAVAESLVRIRSYFM